MGEWLIGETSLFGLAVHNWLLIAAGVFVLYGAGVALSRLRSRAALSAPGRSERAAARDTPRVRH